jgi:hypothetical protein
MFLTMQSKNFKKRKCNLRWNYEILWVGSKEYTFWARLCKHHDETEAIRTIIFNFSELKSEIPSQFLEEASY